MQYWWGNPSNLPYVHLHVRSPHICILMIPAVFHLSQRHKTLLLSIILVVTPLKINMEHNSMEVWFRSFSFRNMADGCRFQALNLPGCFLPYLPSSQPALPFPSHWPGNPVVSVPWQHLSRLSGGKNGWDWGLVGWWFGIRIWGNL